MKCQLYAIAFACSLGSALITGCSTRGHTYCVGNACFHRSYHPLDMYHSLLLRNNPSYDKVIVSPEWQKYPVVDLCGTEIDLNEPNLMDTITNNPSCCFLGKDEYRMSVADKYVHLIMGQSKENLSGFLLTNADLKFPNDDNRVCWPYSALELSHAAQRAGVSEGGAFVVYGKPKQCNDDMYDLAFDLLTDANTAGRFVERYPNIFFAGNDRVDGNRYFVGFDKASNPKDQSFDVALFRLDRNIIRYIRLPDKKNVSPNSITRQLLIDLGFVDTMKETRAGREETWRCGGADDFVEATTCGERVSRLRIATSILCNNGLEIKFPVQETDLKKISHPDHIERRVSK